MYPFERYMKVLKGYVQNRTRPEGCIDERYIAEEAVEFCTQHLSDVSTVGVPSSQKMGVSKPLSGCTVSVVDQDLLNQAHLYVLENTEEVLPYIEYVQSELEEDNHGVSENLRWLAAGPNMAVPLYRSYLIKVDELGFTLVDLSKIGHRNDQFVLASQVKQIFFIDDPMHRGWSVVLSMPNREYNDVIGDEVLGDVIIECEPFTRGMPNVDTFDELVGELGGQNIRVGVKIYGLNDAYVLATKQSVQKILDPDYIIIFCIKNDVCSNKTRRYGEPFIQHIYRRLKAT
ncbi:hypothetical protein Prudu_155S000100, partial [Prunus dulcis]